MGLHQEYSIWNRQCQISEFCYIPLSLHMLTFRLVVAMVAEFCLMVIITLLGQIMITSKRTTRNIVYSPVCK